MTPLQHFKSSPVFLHENSVFEWQQGSQLICVIGPRLLPSHPPRAPEESWLWNLKDTLQAITNRSQESPWQTILLLARYVGRLQNRSLKVRSPHPTASPHPQPQENQWGHLLFTKSHSLQDMIVILTSRLKILAPFPHKSLSLSGHRAIHLSVHWRIRVLWSPTKIKENFTSSRMKCPKATTWLSVLVETKGSIMLMALKGLFKGPILTPAR